MLETEASQEETEAVMYVYFDFVTGERKRTRGKFIGWTEKMGMLKCRYAQFENPGSIIMVPEYCVPPETRALIGQPPGRKEGKS